MRGLKNVVALRVRSTPNLAYKAWVVLLADDRIAYIDHYKSDGRFGVRPVNPRTGEHLPNTAEHWPIEDRLKVPEELSVSMMEFRPAELDEIPPMYRR